LEAFGGLNGDCSVGTIFTQIRFGVKWLNTSFKEWPATVVCRGKNYEKELPTEEWKVKTSRKNDTRRVGGFHRLHH